MDQDAVEENGYVGRFQKPVAVEDRRFEYDVVRLPFARLAHRIDEGWPLSIDSGCLSICVRRRPVRVKHLDLIATLKEHPAVSAFLAGTSDVCRLLPFHMQLAVAKLFL